MTGGCFANAVGVADHSVIPDSQMTSSTHFPRFHPYNGRLHLPGTSWCAETRAGNRDWLKVDLGTTFEICRVATQGLDPRNPDDYKGWVRDFRMYFSLDADRWTIYRDPDGAIMVRLYLFMHKLGVCYTQASSRSTLRL